MTTRSLTKIPIALAALALLAPVTAATAAQERTVSATGEATLRVANDSAAVGLGVSRERRTRVAALRAATAGLRRVIAATERVPGVEPADLLTGRISVRGVHLRKGIVFRASEGIRITLHQPRRTGELIDDAVTAGATGISGPRFFVGDTSASFHDALAAAFDAALANASALAARAGGTLGAAVTVDEGSGPELFSGGLVEGKSAPAGQPIPAPTRPGRSTVTATVHVVFELR